MKDSDRSCHGQTHHRVCSGFVTALVLSLIHTLGVVTAHGESPTSPARGIAALREHGIYESPRAALETDRYKFAATRIDTEIRYETENPANRLRASFSREDARVVWSDAGEMNLRLTAVGYGDEQEALPDVEPRINGKRIEYRRGPIIEWYVNDPRGIEQGFVLPRRLREKAPGELTLTLSMSGDVTPQMDGDGQDVVLKDEAGRVVLRYGQLAAWDVRGKRVPARLTVRDRTVAIRLDDRAAIYPLTVDPLVASELKHFTADDTGVGDRFGVDVAISGDTMVVGAYYKNGEAGAAYVFQRDAGGTDNWGQVKELIASDTNASDHFGSAVAIDGDTIVIGARNNHSTGTVYGTGAVYVFKRDAGGAGQWGQVKKIPRPFDIQGDEFGFWVSISGDTIAAGCPTTNNNAGSVFVFDRNNGGTENWGFVKQLVPTPSASVVPGTFSTVTVSGDTIAVGAYYSTVGGASLAGAAYVFGRDVGGLNNWGQVAELTASDPAQDDNFGIAMSLQGDTLVVGAYYKGTGIGAAYVFERDAGGTWSQAKKLTASDAATTPTLDGFGDAVHVDGDRIVVGAPGKDGKGAAYLFERHQGGNENWGELTKLTASDGVSASDDNFGFRVGLAGDVLAAVTYTKNSYTGEAYLFRVPENQAISVVTPSPASAVYGTPFDVAATASSGLPVSILGSGGCSGGGTAGTATITMTSGTTECVVHYNQDGNANYFSAPEITNKTTAQKAAATVTLSNLLQTYNGSPRPVGVSVNPVGLIVNVTYDGSATAPTNAGSFSVVATINDLNYQGSASGTLTIAKASQTITVTTSAPATATYNTSFNVQATSSSGLAVALTTTGSCSGSGTGSATILMSSGNGNCNVRYNQAGDANYLAAPQVSQKTTAQKASQTINVTQAPPPTVPTQSSFTVAATASSGLPVSVTTSGGGVCSNSGTTITTGKKKGTCTLTFSQSGNTNYAAAPQVVRTTIVQ
jgi:hypothetical protein